MANLLIIGAGGVGQVIARKAARQHPDFPHICWANRSVESCHRVAAQLDKQVRIERLDASSPGAVQRLIEATRAEIVVNAALPYQNLPIMDACAAAGAHYVDTSVPEVPGEVWHDSADSHWYAAQWARGDAFCRRGLTAVLSAGSDPGAVNVYCRYAADTFFDEVTAIDILDVNAGNHGHAFATNFNPEINLREVQAPAHYWQDGGWRCAEPLSVRWDFAFPVVGRRSVYLMDHDELHSLYRHFPTARHIKFWMGFSDQYIDYVKKLKSVGLLQPDPVPVELDDGSTARVRPLRVLKALLPDPRGLAPRYTGDVCLGSLVEGLRDGRMHRKFIYNACSHPGCRDDVRAQAIAYMAGVPALAAALLLARGSWCKPGAHNTEALPAEPFMRLLPELGMPWSVCDLGGASHGSEPPRRHDPFTATSSKAASAPELQPS